MKTLLCPQVLDDILLMGEVCFLAETVQSNLFHQFATEIYLFTIAYFE